MTPSPLIQKQGAPRFAVPALALALGGLAAVSQAQAQSVPLGEATQTLCANGHSTLCSTMPTDMDGHAPSIGYVPDTDAGAPGSFSQTYVDYFGWQAFIALNWPADSSGNPLSGATITSDVTSPRVWQSFRTKGETFAPNGPTAKAEAICGAANGKLQLYKTTKLEPSEFIEAFTPYPLVDRDGNFVVYDVRLNDTEFTYLESNHLRTKEGQAQFGKAYDFTPGVGSTVGAVEIKTSWRILPNQSDWANFFTMDAQIAIPAADTFDNKDLCIDSKVGLVGMHIMQKFTNPTAFSQYWSWATFEHVDNAPLADDAPISPTNGKSKITTTTPPACTLAPNTGDTTTYSFYDPKCTAQGVECTVNTPPMQLLGGKGFKWASEPPYGKAYLTDQTYGTQVARCFDIYDSAKSVSKTYQDALSGSVWDKYTLVGAQWASARSTATGPFQKLTPFAAPVYLGNTTMETYVQVNTLFKKDAGKDYAPGSCIACHDMATDTAGNNANFSFLPSSAQ